MNLFIAYTLAVSPALNDVICVLMTLAAITIFLGIIFISTQTEASNETKSACTVVWFMIKALAILALAWALIPSQKRLNTILLNYHAGCVDVRDEYGVKK